jgi:hypothetical protein
VGEINAFFIKIDFLFIFVRGLVILEDTVSVTRISILLVLSWLFILLQGFEQELQWLEYQ